MRARSILWLLAAGANLALAGPVKLLPTALELPERIGPLVYEGKPNEYGDARLGSSYAYRANGLVLTVYVYDKGIENLPDGGESFVACQEVEQVKSEILQTASYGHARLQTEQLARLAPPADWPLVREAKYELDFRSAPAFSYVWLTAAKGHFVKLRFSADARLRDELPDARRAILAALGAAIAPHLVRTAAPVPAETKENAEPADEKKPGQSLTVNGGLAKKEMGLALIYLLSLSSSLTESPAAAPNCGGEFVPTFAIETAAQRALIQVELESKSKSKYGRTLRKIEAAGFLEEFAWVYLHRPEWSDVVPEGLTLGEFAPWRRKNLKRFEPLDFGHLMVPAPRALPIEPVEGAGR